MKPAIRITKPVRPVLALLCISLCLAACQETSTFDLRHPQPLDFPHERSSGDTNLKFTSYGYDQNFPYDTTANFGADDVTPFEVQSVVVDGRKVDAFQVYNRSINSFLCRANGVQDLRVRFVSNWETGKEVKVEVRGATPAGGAVQLAVAGTAPEKRAANSLAFQHPAVSFPYFHVTSTFLARSYTPFTIESVTVNGESALNYRVLQGRGGGSKPEQIRARAVNDGAISSVDGFTIEIPRTWKSDEELKVVVSGKTAGGEKQELEASAKASWTSEGREGWSHAASLVLHETVGVARQGEPVEVTLGLLHSRVTDPKREIRVVARIPEHPDADGAGYVEFPCQILDVAEWNDRSLIDGGEKDAESGEPIRRYMATTTVQLVFFADVPAYGQRVFLVCYGNPDAQAPVYETDLNVEQGSEGIAQTVSTEHYSIGLAANSAVIETVRLPGDPEVTLEHKIETNGAVHWNPGIYTPPDPWVHASDWEDPECSILTGPLTHRIRRYANLPFIDTTAAHVTYEFFAGQPYVISESVMEVKEDVFVQALRNGEIVFNHAVLNEFVWKDEMGKTQHLDLTKTLKHPIHALEIPADTPWMAFVNREQGVGFASIAIDYHNMNLYGHLNSEAQPYIYVQIGPWIYWSRGLVYPFGGADFTRMMPARKGSVYAETNAYMPFRYAKGSNPFVDVERYHKTLTNPLKVSEHMIQDPTTPTSWIMPLLTMPFDEGVDGAQSAKEVPEK